MFIRPCYRRKNGRQHAYWALVESYRTERGPRQRTVAYLGQLDEAGRLGVKRAAHGNKQPADEQLQLWEEPSPAPQWVEVDTRDFSRPADDSPTNQDYHYHRNAETNMLVGDPLVLATIRSAIGCPSNKAADPHGSDRKVSSMTRKNAAKSAGFSNSVRRLVPRSSAWKTIPREHNRQCEA